MTSISTSCTSSQDKCSLIVTKITNVANLIIIHRVMQALRIVKKNIAPIIINTTTHCVTAFRLRECHKSVLQVKR
jgi:hypothetical protein